MARYSDRARRSESIVAGVENGEASESDPLLSNDASKQETDELSLRQRAFIYACAAIPQSLAALDSTIVSTLAVPISGTFGSFKALAWLGCAYMIGIATAQSITGRLTEIYSRRTGFLISNAIFLLGTIGCGIAPSMEVLVASRAVAGLGAGGMYACLTMLTSQLFTLRQRPVASGCANVVYGASLSLGGLFGGWVNDTWGWRASFLIQVPAIIFGMVGIYLTLYYPDRPKTHVVPSWRRVDWAGAFTLVAFLTSMLVGLTIAGNILPWAHPTVLITLIASVIFFCLFVLVERSPNWAPEPMIPLHLLRNQTVLAVCLSYLFTHMSTFTIAYYMPVYFQLLGFSTTQAGLHFVPFSISDGISALLTGIAAKLTGSYMRQKWILSFLNLIGAILFLRLTLDSPSWYYYLPIICVGFGFGGLLNVYITSAVASVKIDDHALTVSLAFVFRSSGSTLGVTLASTIFQNLLRKNLLLGLKGSDNADAIITMLRENFETIWSLPELTRELVRECYMHALQGVFVYVVVVTALGALATGFIQEQVLHKDMKRTQQEDNVEE